MTDELISKTDVVKIVKSVLSPASSLTNVARARRQMLTEINELESKPEPHWIPVTERLPEEEGEYLVTSVYQYYRDGRKTYKTTVDRWSRNGAGKEWVATSNDAHIAWMPFPEPYKRG